MLLSDIESLAGFIATGGPLLGVRGLPVSLLGDELAEVDFSAPGEPPGGVCFLATTRDTFPLVLFNMATACNKDVKRGLNINSPNYLPKNCKFLALRFWC